MAKRTPKAIVEADAAETAAQSDTKQVLSKEERRQRNIALRDKAIEQAASEGKTFDEKTPAAMFHQNFDNAYKAATESDKGVPAVEILERNKAAAESIAADKAKREAAVEVGQATPEAEIKVDETLVAESEADDKAKGKKHGKKALPGLPEGNDLSEERRAAIAAKAKAKTRADLCNAPWDDSIPDQLFVDNYDEAYQAATTPQLTDAEKQTLADLKAAHDATANDNAAKTETKEEAPAADAVVDPWLKRPNETKSEWKARKKLLAAEAAAKVDTTLSDLNKKLPLEAPEAEEGRNGAAPTESVDVADETDIPDGHRLMTDEEKAYFKANGLELLPYVLTTFKVQPTTDEERAACKEMAAEYVKVFNTAEQTEGATDANVTDTETVVTSVDEPTAPQDDVAPAPVEETKAPVVPEEQQVDPAPEPVVETPVQESAPVTTPTLVVNNDKPSTDNAADQGEENRAATKKLYGSTYNETNAKHLESANYYLDRAIVAQTEKAEQRFYLNMAQALKAEAAAFGVKLEASKLVSQLKAENLYGVEAGPTQRAA